MDDRKALIQSWRDGATPPLADFLAVYEDDDNVWWMLGCGDHMNLFDDAMEEVSRLYGVLATIAALPELSSDVSQATTAAAAALTGRPT